MNPGDSADADMAVVYGHVEAAAGVIRERVLSRHSSSTYAAVSAVVQFSMAAGYLFAAVHGRSGDRDAQIVGVPEDFADALRSVADHIEAPGALFSTRRSSGFPQEALPL